MDRKTANREWRDVTRGATEGVPNGRMVHAFAQRIEALAIAGCDKRHAAAKAIGAQLANVAFNWAQEGNETGSRLTEGERAMLKALQKRWDEEVAPNANFSGERGESAAKEG